MQGQFWKIFYGAWNGVEPKRHTMPEIARGARPAGSGKPVALLPGARHVAPGAAGQNKAIRGASAGGFRLSLYPRLRANLLNRA